MNWFLKVFEALGLNWQTFVSQAAALVGWIILAAIVYTVVEMIVSRLEERQAETLTSYVIWLFFGIAGAHRVYFGRTMTGLAQLALTTITILSGLALGVVQLLATPTAITFTVPVAIWFVLAALTAIWIVADAFLIPDWIRTRSLQQNPA